MSKVKKKKKKRKVKIGVVYTVWCCTHYLTTVKLLTSQWKLTELCLNGALKPDVKEK